MGQIRHVTIIGMGALGIMYGKFFCDALGRDHVTFLADRGRIERYKKQEITCNGIPCDFQFQEGTEAGKPADLLIFAVKSTALYQAIELARPVVGRDTVILSALNGISSEEIIGKELGKEHVLYCVAQGMDAVKAGPSLRYTHMGQLCIGIPDSQLEKEPLISRVTKLFDAVGFPYTREPDILRRLWCKWMLNVGVNQVVMVTEGTYATVQEPGEARERMKAAMREVMKLAEYEGIQVTEEDLQAYVDLTDSLNPQGMPSMRQDGLAGRRSEVELFSGTVIRKAEQAGILVPVNQELYRRITEIEAGYPS